MSKVSADTPKSLPDTLDEPGETTAEGEPLSRIIPGISSPSRRKRWAWGLSLILFIGFLSWFIPPVYKLRNGPVTVTRYTKKEGEIQATLGRSSKGWIGTKKISRYALYAIVSAEDGKFYEHPGLDIAEIVNSARTNLQKKRYARGGSTITQQVVKMAFLGREKTLIRKAREAIGAVLLEQMISKDRILEWYINLAEFGDGVYGIGNGCWHYFRTKPELLSIEQAVHLALVLPSPNAWSRGLRHRSLTAFGQKRFATILNRMRQSGYITKPQWIAAITRGDFGRPVSGYASLIAAEETNNLLCPGNPGCPEADDADTMDDETEELSFPKQFPPPGPEPSPSTLRSGTSSDTGAVGASAKGPSPEAITSPSEAGLQEPLPSSKPDIEEPESVAPNTEP
jgi:monofunctional biosynthetic peptidoglycan transglycosylase